MDSTPKPLTLNDKCGILACRIEQALYENEKDMPVMLKMMYKPAMKTVRTFLAITPEEKLSNVLQRFNMLLEAMGCQYTDEQDFTEHLDELTSAWT